MKKLIDSSKFPRIHSFHLRYLFKNFYAFTEISANIRRVFLSTFSPHFVIPVARTPEKMLRKPCSKAMPGTIAVLFESYFRRFWTFSREYLEIRPYSFFHSASLNSAENGIAAFRVNGYLVSADALRPVENVRS